jgi:hypothetical protein
VIWLEDWSELAGVLNELQRETAAQTYQRRFAKSLGPCFLLITVL